MFDQLRKVRQKALRIKHATTSSCEIDFVLSVILWHGYKASKNSSNQLTI